ncbi:hypothetical protein EYF80_021350 [Liparis tanakae]|uniref:Secreted protein n=1 Tax=Liparis tanakae TaxID=230148 RepID=A0A4Z2HRG9_9TELE|nr:hypothetical protein EYF80_021350 [Liparis tanakae]
MNFSTLCCLILNILEPLLVFRESSSSMVSFGVLILVPRSSSEASGPGIHRKSQVPESPRKGVAQKRNIDLQSQFSAQWIQGARHKGADPCWKC